MGMSDEASELTLCAGGGGKVFRLALMQGLQPVEDIPNELDHVPGDITILCQLDLKIKCTYIYIHLHIVECMWMYVHSYELLCTYIYIHVSLYIYRYINININIIHNLR